MQEIIETMLFIFKHKQMHGNMYQYILHMILQHGHQDYPHSSHMPPTVNHQTPEHVQHTLYMCTVSLYMHLYTSTLYTYIMPYVRAYTFTGGCM